MLKLLFALHALAPTGDVYVLDSGMSSMECTARANDIAAAGSIELAPGLHMEASQVILLCELDMIKRAGANTKKG